MSHRCLRGARGSAGRCRNRSWAAAWRWRCCCSVYCWWCRAETTWRDRAGPRWTRCTAPAVTGGHTAGGHAVRSTLHPGSGHMWAPPGPHLCVEPTGCLQEQRQVGLHLAAVGVGPVLGLALQRGDLVLKSMIPPAEIKQCQITPHRLFLLTWFHVCGGGAAAYRSCSTFLSRAYSRSVTSIFWYRSCRACRDVHTSAAPSFESNAQETDGVSWRRCDLRLVAGHHYRHYAVRASETVQYSKV